MVEIEQKRYADDITLQELVRLRVENERLREALNKTAQYSKWVLQSSSFQGYNLDGGEAQDMAETWDLIVPHKATEENREQWERYEAIELGDTFYEFADWLKSSALQQKESE